MSYIIGITGGSASGKTYLLQNLRGCFAEEELCIVSQDEYYKSKELQPKDSNGIENFDTPDSIDIELFAKDLLSLKAGKEVNKLEYTFNNPTKTSRTILYKPAPVIIAEGIFIFHPEEVVSVLDFKVFINADESVKLSRRLVRDKEERGYDEEDVRYRYEHHVKPCYEKYIKPHEHLADMRILNNDNFKEDLKLLEARIRDLLE